MPFNSQIDDAILALVEQHAIHVENLTKEQVAKVFKEAILCGDFQRHVLVSNNAQSVSYMPYRREYELLARIAALEKELSDLECKVGVLADM